VSPLPALAAALGLDLLTPAAVCDPDRAAWTAPDPAPVAALSTLVDRQLRPDLTADDFGRHHARFDGEWWLGSFAMAAAGFSAAQRVDPDPAHGARAARALDRMLDPAVRAFDTAAWGTDMLDDLDRDDHDHAVLGYVGVAMGAARRVDRDAVDPALHDAVVAALSRRLADQPPGHLLQTYPGEAYPVDNAAVAAAIALHAEATRQPEPPWFRPWLAGWASRWIDPATGLVYQSAHPATGRPTDHPRGSGTALSAWFLSHADPGLAARLGAATRDTLGVRLLDHAAVREYPPGIEGRGDIDSGPLVMGLSVSASGFALGAARAAGDPAWQANLLDTACLFAAPDHRPDGGGAMTGGVLGNAILLAMLTGPTPADPPAAPPPATAPE